MYQCSSKQSADIHSFQKTSKWAMETRGPKSYLSQLLCLSWLPATLMMICLFVLRLNVPVNNFSVMSGRSHRFLGINKYFRGVKCLAQGHNTAAVGIEPPTSRSGVRHSTTEPPRSPLMMIRSKMIIVLLLVITIVVELTSLL